MSYRNEKARVHLSNSGRWRVAPSRASAAKIAAKIDESSRQAGERAAFSRLCESIKDLPPEEQVSRVHEYFGIFGGAPPPKGRPGRERR
jgi:hypothetical protein